MGFLGSILMADTDHTADHYERRIRDLEERLTDRIDDLRRSVEGDPNLNVPSIRNAIQELKTTEIKALRDDLETIKEERKAIKYTLRGILIVVGAGGLSSAGTLITVLRVLAGDAP